MESFELRRGRMDGFIQRKRNEDVCVHLKASRGVLDVRHQDQGQEPRELDGPRRAEDRILRSGLLDYGDSVSPRYSQRTLRCSAQARYIDRSLFFAPRLV